MMPHSLGPSQFGKYAGLMLSIAACAVVVGTQARHAMQRLDEQQSVTKDLGLESAWPHVRVDFSR